MPNHGKQGGRRRCRFLVGPHRCCRWAHEDQLYCCPHPVGAIRDGDPPGTVRNQNGESVECDGGDWREREQ